MLLPLRRRSTPTNVPITLADAAGVAPDVRARPDLAEPLLFGPMLPARYRLDGPGAHRDAAAAFRDQLAASPRAAVEPDDIATLPDVGFADLLPLIANGNRAPHRAVAEVRRRTALTRAERSICLAPRDCRCRLPSISGQRSPGGGWPR